MGCGNNINGERVLRPNLSCPPDLSQLIFRFVDKNSIGVVKGIQELAIQNMSKFFLPLNGYMMFTIVLCPNEVKRIETSSLMDFGKRKEIQEFDLTNVFQNFNPGISIFSTLIIRKNNNIIGEIIDMPSDNYQMFIDNLKNEIIADENIFNEIEFYEDLGNSIFRLRSKNSGINYDYELIFTDNNINISVDSNIIQTALRYPRGAWKMIFLNNIFCSECKGSNEQYIEWAFDSDVLNNGIENANWKKMGPMFYLSGAEDVEETDMNKIETIYVKNPQNCDVEIQAILGV